MCIPAVDGGELGEGISAWWVEPAAVDSDRGDVPLPGSDSSTVPVGQYGRAVEVAQRIADLGIGLNRYGWSRGVEPQRLFLDPICLTRVTLPGVGTGEVEQQPLRRKPEGHVGVLVASVIEQPTRLVNCRLCLPAPSNSVPHAAQHARTAAGDPLTGLEPASSRSLAGCSTTELQRISTGSPAGLEPTSSRLRAGCSTTELRRAQSCCPITARRVHPVPAARSPRHRRESATSPHHS